MSERFTIHSYTDPKSSIRYDIDPSLYALDEEQSSFFKSQTGIQDDEELKRHILAVQKKSYETWSFPCIRAFAFLELGIPKMSIYPQLLELGKSRPGAIFLDLACCFANEARVAVQGGFPVENVICSDLHPEFWTYGHELFRSTEETFPATFLPGDIFESGFLRPREPIYEVITEPPPPLKSIKSLTPLQGHVSAINACRFFHLFDEDTQLELAKRVATLLSPVPGSMIFGLHAGAPEKGIREPGRPMFCHSPETWKKLWNGAVFKEGTVKVEAELRKSRPLYPYKHQNELFHIWWSVTRL